MTSSDQTVVREGVIAVIRRDGRYLVIKRSETVIAPGKICFPGGGIEPGETLRDAVVRECREELGVMVVPGEEIDVSVTPWNVRLHWFTASLSGNENFVPDPKEVAEVRWMTLQEMLDDPDLLESNVWFLKKLLK